jgi:hypothetical protein
MRKTRKEGVGTLMPVNIMNSNITSSLNRAFKLQITAIRARNIPRPRTRVDKFIDKKANSGIFNTWVK